MDDNRNLRIGIEVRFQGLQEITLILLEIHWSKWGGREGERISPIIFSARSCFLILVRVAQEIW